MVAGWLRSHMGVPRPPGFAADRPIRQAHDRLALCAGKGWPDVVFSFPVTRGDWARGQDRAGDAA